MSNPYSRHAVLSALRSIGQGKATDVADHISATRGLKETQAVRAALSNLKSCGLATSERDANGVNIYRPVVHDLAQPTLKPVIKIDLQSPASVAHAACSLSVAPVSPKPLPPISIDLRPAVDQVVSDVARLLSSALDEALRQMIQQQVQDAIARGLGAVELALVTNDAGVADIQAKRVQPEEIFKPLKRQSVTVVGLLAGQAQMITSEFGKEFNLHFVSSSKNEAHRLSSLCKTSDAVIAMTGFISHSLDKIIKSSGVRLIRVSGGMSSLRDSLTQLYLQSEAEEKAAA